ncbi:hypothetical protein FKM82_022497 [Ascaphus truei]
MTLYSIGRREIGQWFETVFLSPILKIGTTLAVFQVLGIWPADRIDFIREASGLAMAGAPRRRNLDCSRSGPHWLLSFNLRSACVISSSDTGPN